MGVLGSGSFGEVKLFENQENGDKIALKEMKIEELNNLSREERDQMIMRIKVEIKIMWEHDNENLVKALCVPQDMHYSPPNNVLHVWMEYCDGGDLRNSVLLKCSNCCGVEEKQLRAICTDMS
jgi:serine/threonine protein kinase